jgi:8-oxo-dGTP pyrophosphatase MutT (NUDIX family)
LVSNKRGDRWVLPKGRPEKHLKKKEIAALEAWEEAGDS